MEKFYSGNLLLLIFTSGTAVGFTPPIFIATVSIGNGFSCISEGDASAMHASDLILYVFNITVLCLYAVSMINVIIICIKIQIIKLFTVIILSIGGTICIIVSFVIIIIFSPKLVKAFYLISLICSMLQYLNLYRQYINEKCKSWIQDEDEEQQAQKN